MKTAVVSFSNQRGEYFEKTIRYTNELDLEEQCEKQVHIQEGKAIDEMWSYDVEQEDTPND